MIGRAIIDSFMDSTDVSPSDSFPCIYSMADSLIDTMMDSLIGPLIDSLIQSPIGGSVDIFLHSLIDALADSAIGPFIDTLMDSWGDSLIYLLIDWPRN